MHEWNDPPGSCGIWEAQVVLQRSRAQACITTPIRGAVHLKPEAEPYTPCRTTRGSKRASVSKTSKATQAENVLMRALGIVLDDLEGNDDNIAELAEIFESPLREQHIRVIAALFGKEVPPMSDMAAGEQVVVGAA